MSLPHRRAITKKEQADMGKLKKSVRGLVVVHPMTALGREMGLKEMTGFARVRIFSQSPTLRGATGQRVLLRSIQALFHHSPNWPYQFFLNPMVHISIIFRHRHIAHQ
jgi:hypothetical protein